MIFDFSLFLEVDSLLVNKVGVKSKRSLCFTGRSQGSEDTNLNHTEKIMESAHNLDIKFGEFIKGSDTHVI